METGLAVNLKSLSSNMRKKMLYVGQLNAGGTCLDRMHSLQRLGFDVAGFNVCEYQSSYRVIRSIQSRLQPRALLKALNSDVLLRAAEIRGLSIVWIDKGVWIFPETLLQLRKRFGAKLVHYTPDPQFFYHRSRHLTACVPIYDLMVTTKSFELEEYQSAGAENIVLCQQSYCPIRYESPSKNPSWEVDIGFIGHCETHYWRTLIRLVDVGEVGIWGQNWRNMPRLSRLSDNAVRGVGLFGRDYVDALASFKISLGLLSKLIPERHTTRSFEIPAAGGFLLAERSDEHCIYFEEGVEAEFFDSTDELIDKAGFYLTNDRLRLRIAAAGRERCRDNGYDNDSVLRRIVLSID